jgi:hypothetical protein
MILSDGIGQTFEKNKGQPYGMGNFRKAGTWVLNVSESTQNWRLRDATLRLAGHQNRAFRQRLAITGHRIDILPPPNA